MICYIKKYLYFSIITTLLAKGIYNALKNKLNTFTGDLKSVVDKI